MPHFFDGHTQLLDLKTTAERLSVSPETVRKWVKQAKIPYVKLGRRLLFSVSDLSTWIEANRHGARLNMTSTTILFCAKCQTTEGVTVQGELRADGFTLQCFGCNTVHEVVGFHPGTTSLYDWQHSDAFMSLVRFYPQVIADLEQREEEE